jgi:hypothetical protein
MYVSPPPPSCCRHPHRTVSVSVSVSVSVCIIYDIYITDIIYVHYLEYKCIIYYI